MAFHDSFDFNDEFPRFTNFFKVPGRKSLQTSSKGTVSDGINYVEILKKARNQSRRNNFFE